MYSQDGTLISASAAPHCGAPLEAGRAATPMGTQQKKSDMATVMRRRAMVMSLVFPLALATDMALDEVDEVVTKPDEEEENKSSGRRRY